MLETQTRLTVLIRQHQQLLALLASLRVAQDESQADVGERRKVTYDVLRHGAQTIVHHLLLYRLPAGHTFTRQSPCSSYLYLTVAPPCVFTCWGPLQVCSGTAQSGCSCDSGSRCIRTVPIVRSPVWTECRRPLDGAGRASDLTHKHTQTQRYRIRFSQCLLQLNLHLPAQTGSIQVFVGCRTQASISAAMNQHIFTDL